MMANDNISPAVNVIAGAVFPPICAIIVFLRFFTRRRQNAKLGIDDWLTLPALILLIGMSAAVICGVELHAVGYLTPESTLPVDSPPHQDDIARTILWAIELMYFLGLGSIKLSFLFFYRRIFVRPSGSFFQNLTLTVIIIVVIWTMAFFLCYLFTCKSHPAYYWTTIKKQEYYCLSVNKLHLAYTLSDVLLDLIIIIIPIPLVWQLSMSCSRKLGVLGVFALGSLSLVASIVRLVEYLEGVRRQSVYSEVQATFVIYWVLLELGVGIIAACLPSLAPLFKNLTPAKILNKICTISCFTTKLRDRGSPSSPVDGVDVAGSVQIHVTTEFGVENEVTMGYDPDEVFDLWFPGNLAASWDDSFDRNVPSLHNPYLSQTNSAS